MKFLFFGLVLVAVVVLYRKWLRQSRQQFIVKHEIPSTVVARFREKHPQLTDAQAVRVCEGLRQYFLICARAQGRFVAMPSQVVDDLWHTFILFTRQYERFCKQAYGRFLHHTPVEAMSTPHQATAGIRRTWWQACRLEGINPSKPERLPLLFALDAELGIANGFIYTLNCAEAATSSSNTFCASSIGCGSSTAGCGGDSGHGDGGSSCGSSCGGGGGD